jgi:hypothetical protein
LSEPEAGALSAHVRCEDRDGVARVLRELSGGGLPLSVWPPRALPPGILISPARYGWTSFWGAPTACPEYLPDLAASLECDGLLLLLEPDAYWLAQLFRGRRRVAALSSPAGALVEEVARELAEDELQARGAPSAQSTRELLDRARALGESGELHAVAGFIVNDLSPFRPLLPRGGSIEEAEALLRAWDRHLARSDEGSTYAFIEDALENFANYLGIRDAAWDPLADWEALAAGDYEDCEGLPEGWPDFILLPAQRWELVTE